MIQFIVFSNLDSPENVSIIIRKNDDNDFTKSTQALVIKFKILNKITLWNATNAMADTFSTNIY